MARYPLNLPQELKREAEQLAREQGVSLNQFILWAVAEKVGALQQGIDDPNFPRIMYRRGASGFPTPIVRGTGVRVQTLVGANRSWGMSAEEIAGDYDLKVSEVKEALSFYESHRNEIDAAIASEHEQEI